MTCNCCGGSGALLYDDPSFLIKLHNYEPMPWQVPKLQTIRLEDGHFVTGFLDYCLFCRHEKFSGLSDIFGNLNDPI